MLRQAFVYVYRLLTDSSSVLHNCKQYGVGKSACFCFFNKFQNRSMKIIINTQYYYKYLCSRKLANYLALILASLQFVF